MVAKLVRLHFVSSFCYAYPIPPHLASSAKDTSLKQTANCSENLSEGVSKPRVMKVPSIPSSANDPQHSSREPSGGGVAQEEPSIPGQSFDEEPSSTGDAQGERSMQQSDNGPDHSNGEISATGDASEEQQPVYDQNSLHIESPSASTQELIFTQQIGLETSSETIAQESPFRRRESNRQRPGSLQIFSQGDATEQALERSIELAQMTLNDSEFDLLLERMKKDQEDSIKSNPSDYVPDHLDMELILDLIERLESTPKPDQPESSSNAKEGSLKAESTKDNHVEDCPICLESMKKVDNFSLPCKHEMHRECTQTWVRYTRHSGDVDETFVCPVCRDTFRVKDDELF